MDIAMFEPKLIKTKDERLLIYYENYIFKHLNIDIKNRGDTYINEAVDKYFENINEHNQFICDMESSAKQYILPKEKFDWIKVDERHCFFIWLSVRNRYNPDLTVSQYRDKRIKWNEQTLYDQMRLDINPASTKARYESIIRFFDTLGASVNDIELYFSFLKEALNNINSYSFTWLDEKDEEQCQWAWDYIKKSDNGIYNRYIQTPIGENERYLFVIASFDYWYAHADTKLRFLDKMRNAWMQKKHRSKQVKENRKPLNTNLDEEVKKRLNLLAKLQNKTISETLEDMINQAYEEHKQLFK